MALLDRKYWMGLLTASLALSLVAACAPRKKDWKTRVNVDPRKVGGAGEKGNGEKTGPGGTPTLPGVTGSGGLSEVAGSNGKCISLTANRSEPLFVDQAIGQYFSQQGPSIKLVSNEEADKSDLKKFRVISTGKDIVVGTDELVYDFSKAVLDPSGCFKVVVDQKTLEDSKSIGNSPVALLFLDNSGLTVQIRDYSDEQSKAKFIQMYDALVDNKTVENVSFESFGRLEAIFVSLNADVNVSASTSGVASASPDGAQTEDEKTKKDNEILKDLEARTSKITAYHLVFPIQNVEQKAIGGISRFYVNNMKADSERSFFSGQLPYRDAMSGKSIDMELQTEKASIEKFKGVRQSISKQSPSFKENLEIVLSNKTDESDAAIELTVTVVKKEDAIPFFAGSVKKNQEPKKTDDASAQDAASDPDKTKAEDVFREDDPSDTANETVPTAQTEGKVYSGSSSEVIDLTTKQPADAAQTPAEPQVEATTQPSTLI